MERDPLRLIWKTTPWRHAVGFVLLGLSGLTLLLGLDLIRAAADIALRADGAADAISFLRFEIPLPREIAPGPLVILEGVPLGPEAFARVAVAGVVLAPLLMAILGVLIDWLSVGIGARVITRVRQVVLDASLEASPAVESEVASLHQLAADDLSREGRVLGAGLFVSLRQTGVVVLSLVYVLLVDWRAGVALAALLIFGAALNARRLRLRLDLGRIRDREGEKVERIFSEMRHRAPAIRAHGTAAGERTRLAASLSESHTPVERWERRLAVAEALSTAMILLAPMAILAVAGWYAPRPSATAGSLAATSLAGALAAFALRESVQWRRVVARTRAILAAIADGLTAIRPRSRTQEVALPASGALVAEGVSAIDPENGARIAGLDLRVTFPAQLALTGDGDRGPRVLAALLGGSLSASTGHLTFGGVDLSTVPAIERGRRIALAGDTVLIPGTLRDNFLYGAAGDDLDLRLSEAIATTALDRLTHARGLSGNLDPRREEKLAAAIVEARRAVHAALIANDLDRFVDPFAAERYNRYATIGENLLFGKAIGDTFREDRLAGHPFIRAILEAEDLTKPLSRMGLSIAGSMIEIFAEVPDGHPLFERFGFFSASDRPYFEDLVERRRENRRGVQTARDQEKLIGLALRYNESRHRLGLIDDAMEARIVTARGDLARMLPLSLQAAIEFYDASRLCAAASVQDNLLFGRAASDQAGAEAAIQEVIRRVLTERGLDAEVARIGLNTPIDLQGSDLTVSEIALIDLVRCLVRRPDILVVERALEGLPTPAAETLVANLRRAMTGRGLVLVTPEVTDAMQTPPFDAVIRFNRGAPTVERRQPASGEAPVA